MKKRERDGLKRFQQKSGQIISLGLKAVKVEYSAHHGFFSFILHSGIQRVDSYAKRQICKFLFYFIFVSYWQKKDTWRGLDVQPIIQERLSILNWRIIQTQDIIANLRNYIWISNWL